MSDFERALEFVFKHEGGFTTIDGGTNYGITQGTYDAWNTKNGRPREPVRDIDPSTAKTIYREEYWNPVYGDNHIWPRNLLMFNAAVNCGVSVAKMLDQASPTNIHYLLHQIVYYRDVVERKPTKKKYFAGWINRTLALYDLISEEK